MQQFNLAGNIAHIEEIESIFNKDAKYNFKLLKEVTEVVLHPKHYAKMDAKNAVKFHSNDVISALNFKAQQAFPEKISPTAFILSCFQLYHNFITSTTSWSINEP